MKAKTAPRRTVPVAPAEVEVRPPWSRQTWVALGVMGVLVAAVLGSGLLIDHALAPSIPPALAGCRTSTQTGPHTYFGPQPICITAGQKFEATVTTTQGVFVMQLHPEVAPVTVNNFIVLAIHGYYTGLTFWKSEDWVVQGGDPRGDGRGGPGYNLPDEASNTPWGPGAVGMARVPGGSVNGSQFFVQKGAWPDPGPTATYNRFATVTSGQGVVQLLTTSDSIISVTIRMVS